MTARPSWAVGSDTERLLDTEATRLAIGALWTPDGVIGAQAGFRPSSTTAGKVTASSTPDTHVHVAAFQAVLPSSRGDGPYILTLDAADDLDVLGANPADPANPRHDLVIAQQSDALYGDADSNMDVRVVTGTAAPSPADPTVDGSPDYILLARIRVSANAVTIADGDIDDLRPSPLWTVALGGILPVSSQAERDALSKYPGLTVWRSDHGWAETYTGAGWTVQGTATVSTSSDLDAITDAFTGQLAVVSSESGLYRYDGSQWVADDTSGTWNPTVSWSVPGTWAGTWRKQAGLIVATASITLTANASAFPGSNVFTVTGWPNPGQFVGGGCFTSWGTRAFPAYLSGGTAYVNMANATASPPQVGQLIAVTASYYAGS